MKVKDWILIGAILVIAFGIYSMAYDNGVMKQLRKELDQKAKDAVEAIAKNDAEIASLDSNIQERNGELIELHGKLDKLNADKEMWKEDAIYWKEKAKEAPPEVLVVDVRAILETDEVWQTPDGIMFSLEAFRKVSLKLYDYQEFVLEREPNYLKTIDLYKTNIYLLTGNIGDMKTIISDWSDKFDIQQTWNDDLMTYLKKRDKGSWWKTVQKVGTGIAVGVVTAYVIKDVISGKK